MQVKGHFYETRWQDTQIQHSSHEVLSPQQSQRITEQKPEDVDKGTQHSLWCSVLQTPDTVHRHCLS